MNIELIEVLLWTVAGIVSFYFSLGNARVWTSIAVGFSLVLFAEVIPKAVLGLLSKKGVFDGRVW